MKKLLKWVLIIFFGVPFALVVLGNIAERAFNKETSANKENITQEQKVEKKVEEKLDPKSKVSPDAFLEITKSYYPKTYKKWGSSGVKRINELAPLAGERVAESRRCDKVIDIGLSDAKSKPKKHIVFYVDCKNKERFYVTESDIKNKKEVFSINELFNSINKEEYYQSCLSAIKARANHPSTVDSSIFGRAIGTSTTGDIIVNMDFSARNSFNLEEKFTAECYWTDDKFKINIFNK